MKKKPCKAVISRKFRVTPIWPIICGALITLTETGISKKLVLKFTVI